MSRICMVTRPDPLSSDEIVRSAEKSGSSANPPSGSGGPPPGGDPGRPGPSPMMPAPGSAPNRAPVQLRDGPPPPGRGGPPPSQGRPNVLHRPPPQSAQSFPGPGGPMDGPGRGFPPGDPRGMPPIGMDPRSMPNDPRGMPPPNGMDPRNMPNDPRGMPPHDPRGMPNDPRRMPPNGMDPRGMPPNGMDPRGPPPPGMDPRMMDNRGPGPGKRASALQPDDKLTNCDQVWILECKDLLLVTLSIGVHHQVHKQDHRNLVPTVNRLVADSSKMTNSPKIYFLSFFLVFECSVTLYLQFGHSFLLVPACVVLRIARTCPFVSIVQYLYMCCIMKVVTDTVIWMLRTSHATPP